MGREKKEEDEALREDEKSNANEVENLRSTDEEQAASECGEKVWKSIVQHVVKSSADGDDVQSRGVSSAVQKAS